MWTLPDLQGVSLKWALKFLLKHTTFYQNMEISLIWIKYFPIYSIHVLINLPEMKEKSSWCHLSHLMTKPTKWLCAQRRLRSALASAQSDQSLRCPHEASLGPLLPIEPTAKTLIRLGGCPGWSESSLGAQSHSWFCHEAAHFEIYHMYGY